MKTGFLLILIYASILQAFSGNNQNINIPCYKITLHFIPGSGNIRGTLEITNPADSLFRLDSCLNVKSVSADNRDITFSLIEEDGRENIYALRWDKMPAKISIEWEGNITAGDLPKHLGSYNMISRDLIELTDHISWYPVMKSRNGFIFTLTADLPREYTIITNGEDKEESDINGNMVTTWITTGPVYNITFLAARNMRISRASDDGFNLEIYYKTLPESYIDSMKNDLMETLRLYTQLYGTHKASDNVRIVYSPRTAGGYARAPLIVVSENYASDQRHMKYGYARDFHLNAHEIAHYWSKADTWSADDWINEGMAEYSALLASEKVIGKNFSDFLINEYTGIVNSSDTHLSILETTGDSWELNINRYYKPTLLLNELRQKYGDDRFFKFLRMLDNSFARSGAATTKVFLEVLENNLGIGARDYMEEALNREKWITGNKSTEENIIPADTVLQGTWSGKLTQFGSVTQFVLHLKMSDGTLVPSLDSPDQNAFGIPASDLCVKGDTISFRVGVASASFKGTIKRSKMLINGSWIQRGTTYPLVLLRSE